ncbi:hypothetical protein ACIA8O_15380 [Kitasatospora sp. NPDC051853]|uniref:hypothetical protein n=1 Tax=Kitasatospora sp. NPDC051853 TaxID=3364058 RepID=UPI00378B331B
MSVSYTPGFKHTDWVDNVDRVRAAGDNGFNIRFHALEAEFARLAEVIAQVADALQQPAPRPVKITLTPTLTSLGDPWTHVYGGAAKPAGAIAAGGMMALQLPQGSTIKELRVCGRKDAGNLSVGVRRQSLAAGSTTELIVSLTLGTGNFDTTTAAPSTPPARVDNEQFRYYLTADLDTSTGASVVQLTCFQITCLTA